MEIILSQFNNYYGKIRETSPNLFIRSKQSNSPFVPKRNNLHKGAVFINRKASGRFKGINP